MIDRREIIERAGELSLRSEVVEKDYVLGWVLAGVANHAEIASTWAFKGGTCLKKVHFETYRFSEDLDFTLDSADQVDAAFLRRVFTEIAAWIYEQSGIEFPADQLRFDVYANKRGNPSVEGRLYYRGPLTPRGSLPAIRLDLTADERVVLPPELAVIDHPYTDAPHGGIRVRAYPFVEVFAEKVRALGDRGSPRDLYDVVNLFRLDEARERAGEVLAALREKCAFKSLPLPTLQSLSAHRAELVADWTAMLSHQLPVLPPFESFWSAIAEFFGWLYGGLLSPRLAPHHLATGELLRPPAGGYLALGLRRGQPLEAIRFAAANHLCVDLEYEKSGRRSTRRIKPYSLRRAGTGKILLHAERADGKGHRSYHVEQITAATVTSETFTPKWRIELSPERAGLDAIPHSGRRASSPRLTIGSRSPWQPLRTYQCTTCGRRFEPRSDNWTLRAHKNSIGGDCPGRRGVLVSTGF